MFIAFQVFQYYSQRKSYMEFTMKLTLILCLFCRQFELLVLSDYITNLQNVLDDYEWNGHGKKMQRAY